MQTIVDGYLSGLKVGDGVSVDRMTLFPIFGQAESPIRYRVLSEALADGSVEVRERPSATVPELWLVNRSDAMALVLDGEEVVGGRQNRIVNASFLIGAKSEVAIPVSCVEHGRWHDVAPSFDSGEATYFSLRREKEQQVRENLRATGRAVADQGAVWDAIAAKQRETRTRSATGAMNDVYREKAKELSDYERALPRVEGAVGMAVALNGRMAGADLFDQPATAGKLWQKLVRSYAMDALDGEKAEPVARERAERLLKRLVGARAESFPSIGLGQDLRLEGDRAVGSALVFEGIVVHLGVFRIHGHRTRSGSTDVARASIRRRLHRTDPRMTP
ncbi:MAG: ARPP-1 family domain-containing protein [Chloroflexota bacterium]